MLIFEYVVSKCCPVLITELHYIWVCAIGDDVVLIFLPMLTEWTDEVTGQTRRFELIASGVMPVVDDSLHLGPARSCTDVFE